MMPLMNVCLFSVNELGGESGMLRLKPPTTIEPGLGPSSKYACISHYVGSSALSPAPLETS